MIDIPTALRHVTTQLENETKDMTDIAKLFYLKEKLLKLETTKVTGVANFMHKMVTIQVCKEALKELSNAENISI